MKPKISWDYGSFTDSRDDDKRQFTVAEALAMGVAPMFVIGDTGPQMIHADCVRCKGIEEEFPITKWDFVF